ncbi:MAG: electron transport complex subunit RsxC [Actinomycetota bacterium]|nr:electron transport complex subunit RsxC [Actinomycetota bacterium]
MKRIKRGLIFPERYDEAKKALGRKKIEEISLPEEIIIPMSQHIGAPASPIVSVGERVLVGQKVADSEAFISAPMHSSVSGEVKAIEPRLGGDGKKVLSIVITPDDKEETISFKGLSDEEAKDPDRVRAAVREAGVVGMGGAGFPTHVKLTPPKDKPIFDVIINGGECEPYLAADHRNFLERGDKILDGLKIIMATVGAKRGYIGIETNKIDAIYHMDKLASSEGNIKVMPLNAIYPQGAEKQLIETILGKEVPSGGLPSDVGALVQNAGTAAAISEAVRGGRPLIERTISVSGHGMASFTNIRAKIGTPISHIIEECGGFKGKIGKVVVGGPMTGVALFDLSVPVIKGTSGVIAFTVEDTSIPNPRPCIRCGRCVDICPVRIMPNYISQYIEVDQVDRADDFDVMDCIECGLCSYVCPATRPFIQLIRHAKAKIIAEQKREEK